ncbi:MAG: zinc metallopeptidase [Anaerolineaceae bacterium]|nr:zinc metallopeptidase [Anaerolineaceae bacterium]
MFFDPLFICFLIPSIVLGFIAQSMVKSRFQKYSQVRTARGLTGAQVARRILDENGLYNVAVEETQGFLSDHYDPRSRTLRLSPAVARQPSVAAVGVAAHETGHALQHAQGYMPLQIRSVMVPAVQFGSNLAPWIIMGGILLATLAKLSTLGIAVAWIGIFAYAAVALFALVTLPVELDASARAKKILYNSMIVDKRELDGVSSVLNAAAWTYVVAALAAVMQLAYWVIRVMGVRRN